MTGSPLSALDSLNISWRFLIVNGDAPREEKDVFDPEIMMKHAAMMVPNAMIKKRCPERVRLFPNAKLESSSFFFFCDDTTNNGCLCGSSSLVVVSLVVVIIASTDDIATTIRCSFVCARVSCKCSSSLEKPRPAFLCLGFCD